MHFLYLKIRRILYSRNVSVSKPTHFETILTICYWHTQAHHDYIMTKQISLNPDNTLYITDSPEEFRVLKTQGHIAIPMINFANRSLCWPHSDYCLEGSFDDYEADNLENYFDYDYLLHV